MSRKDVGQWCIVQALTAQQGNNRLFSNSSWMIVSLSDSPELSRLNYTELHAAHLLPQPWRGFTVVLLIKTATV